MINENELLVLKFSSELIACKAAEGSTVVDESYIKRIGHDILQLLVNNQELGIVIVTSAARKLLGKDVHNDVYTIWDESLGGIADNYLIDDDTFDRKSVNILYDAMSGRVPIVNGNDELLDKNSRWRNNDYVAADILGKAATMSLFTSHELGMFTNVHGLLADIDDGASVLKVVDDFEMAMSYVMDHSNCGTTGGMATKVDAASVALQYGAQKVWIAHGQADRAIMRARSGDIGTTFTGMGTVLARKN